MIEKNLKYFRLKKGITYKELAEKCGISASSISSYEKGKQKPSVDILKKIAAALDVRVSDFLTIRNENLSFQHGEFRKISSLGKHQQEYIREFVEEYFTRFFTVIDILGESVLPPAPECHKLHLTDDDEENARVLRRHLKFAEAGPVGNLIESLENQGILFCLFDEENDSFSGMNGFVNERPYIILNSKMSPERNRSTTAHELAHLMFDWPSEMSEPDIEQKATAISGAFLFPAEDALRELGIRRRAITNSMSLTCKEYGISMWMLAKRAEICGIISKEAAKGFYAKTARWGWQKNEPSRISPEQPSLFKQLVYRAVGEEEISFQRGAELLHCSYGEIREACSFKEVENGVY